MDKITQQEQLSAMMDGELSEFEFRRLLSRLESDDGEVLMATWQRYHLIGAAMRGETLLHAERDIAGRVGRALADAPAPRAAPRAARHPAWLKPVAGAAIAASVAVVTVFTLSPGQGDGVAPTPLTVQQVPAATTAGPLAPQAVFDAPTGEEPFAADGWRALTVGTHWREPAGSDAHIDEERLNRYLLEHSEFERRYGVGGFMPYASFVSYDPK